MKVNLSQRSLSLQPRELLAVADAQGLALQCTHGRIWLTTPDLPGDHILNRDMQFLVPGRGKVVLEALTCSTIRFASPQRDGRPIELDGLM